MVYLNEISISSIDHQIFFSRFTIDLFFKYFIWIPTHIQDFLLDTCSFFSVGNFGNLKQIFKISPFHVYKKIWGIAHSHQLQNHQTGYYISPAL